MGILAKVGGALQRLFGQVAQIAADESGVIQRTRKFDPLSLARTFVLGFLQDPNASDEKLAQMAGQCGAAVLKLQTELDLRSGALEHVEIEPGRSPDGATSRQDVRRGQGSLRISDLGYFALAVFAAMASAREYFLSRLQFGTHVLLNDG